MDHSAYLPLFLLAMPVVLAIVDRVLFSGGTSAATGRSSMPSV